MAPEATTLCSDCPPIGYPTEQTRCADCPRRLSASNSLTLDKLMTILRACKPFPRLMRSPYVPRGTAYEITIPREYLRPGEATTRMLVNTEDAEEFLDDHV